MRCSATTVLHLRTRVGWAWARRICLHVYKLAPRAPNYEREWVAEHGDHALIVLCFYCHMQVTGATSKATSETYESLTADDPTTDPNGPKNKLPGAGG